MKITVYIFSLKIKRIAFCNASYSRFSQLSAEKQNKKGKSWAMAQETSVQVQLIKTQTNASLAF